MNTIEVNLHGCNSVQLDEAYALVEQLGPVDYVLCVDEHVLKSSLAPKTKFKMKTKKASAGATDLKGLRMQLSAQHLLENLVEKGVYESHVSEKLEPVRATEVKAQVFTSELTVAEDRSKEEVKAEEAPAVAETPKKRRGRPRKKAVEVEEEPNLDSTSA